MRKYFTPLRLRLWEKPAKSASEINSPKKKFPTIEFPGSNEQIINLNEDLFGSLQATSYNSLDPDSDSEPDSNLEQGPGPGSGPGPGPGPGHYSPPTSPVNPRRHTLFTRHYSPSSLGPWNEIKQPKHFMYKPGTNQLVELVIKKNQTPIMCQTNRDIQGLKSFLALKAYHNSLINTWINTSNTSAKNVILTPKVASLAWLIRQLELAQTPEQLDDSTKAQIEKDLKTPRNFIGHIKNFLHARFGIFKPVTSWHLYTELLKDISNLNQTTPTP